MGSFSFFIAVRIRAITFHAFILRCVSFFLVIIPVRTDQNVCLLNKERDERKFSEFISLNMYCSDFEEFALWIRSCESHHLYTIQAHRCNVNWYYTPQETTVQDFL